MSNLLYENLAQEGTTVILYTQSNPRISKELGAATACGGAQLVECTVMYKKKLSL